MPLLIAGLRVHPGGDVLGGDPALHSPFHPHLSRRRHEHPDPAFSENVTHQRQLDHHGVRPGRRRQAANLGGDQRVGQVLELGELLPVGKDDGGQRPPIDDAVDHDGRPAAGHGVRRRAAGAQYRVADSVRLYDGGAEASQHFGERRLAGANATEDHHTHWITRYSHGATVPWRRMATNIHNWQQRVDWTLSAILWVGYGLSLFLSGWRDGATPGVTLAAVFAGTYVVAMQIIPRRVRNTAQLGEILAIMGVIVALVGTALTGGIESGYVIFLVAPAFFAGAFLGSRVGLETALLAAVGLVVVVAALGQPVLDGRVLESVALFVLIALTMSQMRRILVEERIRSDELAATTEIRISRLETAHDLLESLSNLASAAELNPVTVGQAALRDIAARVPFAAGQVLVTAGDNDVVAATRGEPDTEAEPHEYTIRIAERTVGRLLLWPLPETDLADWRESIELALQPVAIAFENSRLLQQIAHRAVRGERSRIARELHDDIGPSLASLGLSIDMAIHQFETAPELTRHLDATRRHITALIETVRGAAADLRQDETESVVEKAHILAADVDADGPSVMVAIDELRPPRGNTAVEIKAILTEAFRNAVAHSGATTVSVQGVVDRDSGRIVVVDDGSGFEPTATPRGHFGIIGMKERAANIDADLDVSSRAGVGTTVSISWGRQK